MTHDPRALGFNYGAGWGKDQKPAVYYQGTLLANRLGRQAMDASAAAWAVDHRRSNKLQ